jgi:sortase A
MTLAPAAVVARETPTVEPATNSAVAVVRRRDRLSLRTTAVIALATIAAASSWFVVFGRTLSGVESRRAQATLADRFREQLAAGVAPTGDKPIPVGAPVARISIPALGLHHAVVVEGTAGRELAKGPGHRRDTVLPGEEGTSVLFGRSTWFDAPFAHLASVHKGAAVAVTTGEGEYRYRVTGVRRAGDRRATPLLVGQGRLTLVTSERAPRAAGAFALRTVFVDASLVGTPEPPSIHRPGAVLAAESTMRGDGRALFAVMVWLELLVLATVGVVWTSKRWPLGPLLLVGTPVALALLWATMDAAARLLPNLY